MTSSAQRRGDRWELQVEKAIRERDLYVVRAHDRGEPDLVDFHLERFGVQAKAYQNIGRGMREGLDSALRDPYVVEHGLWPVALLKRPQKDVQRAYAVLEVRSWLDIVAALAS